jgi:DNA-binding response OmpR family regulator
MASKRRFVAVVGHGPDLGREEGAARTLRQLGAEVRTIDLWDEPALLFRAAGGAELPPDEQAEARAIVVEAGARPDLAVAVLRGLRREARLERVGAVVALAHDQVARLDPAGGFDDFVLCPFVPAELYARIRLLEWRRSEFSTEERTKVGDLVIDRSAHEVSCGGAVVPLTAREFALLGYLAERRGKVVSRDELLRKVWGGSYDGGARTVDIHVRRLRAKLGAALDLRTYRGAGYKLAAPAEPLDEEAPSSRSERRQASVDRKGRALLA